MLETSERHIMKVLGPYVPTTSTTTSTTTTSTATPKTAREEVLLEDIQETVSLEEKVFAEDLFRCFTEKV